MRIIACLCATAALLFLCACKTTHISAPQASDIPEIEESVLAHMVTNAATDLTMVRFVTLSPERLEQLRKRCGEQFQISSVKPDETHLIGITKEGSLIEAGGIKITGKKAEAYGTYSHSYLFDGQEMGSVVTDVYQFRERHHRWELISVRNYSAT
jgi:hypothetical protein